MDEIIPTFSIVGRGLCFSISLLGGSFILGISLGIILSIIRHSRFGFWVDKLVNVIRGTPLVLQLSLVYFSLPSLGIHLSVMLSGIIAFGINSSAYIAEILRAGIESLPKGQFEAAETLGIPKYYAWKDIILPQVVRNVFPALINEIIAVLKETSIISIIGGADIMRHSQIVAAEKFDYFMPLCVAGVYYYLLVSLIAFIGKKIDVKISC
ncbi:MAG: amino acid ABC transporter permease [Holosporaceae bacterium]|jgi:polar amino acid transport system permease protein|nr:amino acid ABC transporter permease [Holosporaceae bacterium]